MILSIFLSKYKYSSSDQLLILNNKCKHKQMYISLKQNLKSHIQNIEIKISMKN